MPHIHCYLGKPSLVWTMFFSNLLIGLAYLGISITLWALIKKIKIPFNAIILCFGVFIGACGVTHLLEVWTLWHPDYWIAASVSTLTAIASLGTAIYLYRLRHSIVKVAEAAKKSEQQRLELETLAHSLEQKVLDRTKELHKTTAILSSIMNSTSDIVYLKDRESRMAYCNPMALKLIAKSESDLYGKNDVEFLGEGKGGEKILQTDQRIMQSGKAETTEEWVTWSDGSRRLYLSRKEPHRDPQGNIIGLVGISTDITEKKKAERAQQITEIKLKSVLDNVPVGIGVSDSVGKLEYLNPKGVEIWTGMKEVDLAEYHEYQAWDAITGERLASEDWGMAIAIQKQKKASPRLLKIKAFDGTEKYIMDSANPIFAADGEFIGGVATAQEVTSLMIAEKKLKESEARFRQFADAIPQLGWIANAEGYIYWFNENWYSYTGTKPEDMQGWGWQSVHDPKFLPEVLEKWNSSIASGEPFVMEYPIKSAKGEFRWFLTRIIPIKDEQGRVIQWFGTNTDIHDLRMYQEHLQESVQSRDDFLSIASHELKTPLTSLKLQSQQFERSLRKNDPAVFEPDRIRQFSTLTNKQVDRLTRLVDDMLDISRIRFGKLTINKTKLDVCELVNDVIERMKPQFIQSGAPAPILKTCSQLFATADKMRLEQVMMNLLTNALRYGSNKQVTVEVLSIGQNVQIQIKDQGIGISKEAQEKIFERFERAIEADEVSGLGLGLYISRQIVLAHSGKIWVESELGKGSTFYVEIPV